MADNLFKLNNQSSEQIQLLKSIQQSQNDILGELSSLKKRISNIEHLFTVLLRICALS